MEATLTETRPLAPSSNSDDTSTRARWIGRVMSGFVVLFLAFDGVIKLASVPEAVKGTADLGFSASLLRPLGAIEMVCLILYLVPRTAPLGALLWTGYLGGAVATHVRMGSPLLSHTLFPLYVAALLWGGLYLRDARVRALVSRAA